MSTLPPTTTTAPELQCGNCGQALAATDKFCRECGLPTLLKAEMQRAVPTAPPDTAEFRRAMDLAPDPQPFLRPSIGALPEQEASSELSTSSVLKVTNPTFATRLAGSTLVMVGLVIFLVGLGVLLLVLAIRG